jgi:hypothetical protein
MMLWQISLPEMAEKLANYRLSAARLRIKKLL